MRTLLTAALVLSACGTDEIKVTAQEPKPLEEPKVTQHKLLKPRIENLAPIMEKNHRDLLEITSSTGVAIVNAACKGSPLCVKEEALKIRHHIDTKTTECPSLENAYERAACENTMLYLRTVLESLE